MIDGHLYTMRNFRVREASLVLVFARELHISNELFVEELH